MTNMVGVNYSARAEYFELLPLAALYQNNELDEELANLATNFLVVLAQTMTLAEYIPQAIEAIEKVAKCPSWSSRAVLADFIPVFVFYNMATINAEKQWNQQVILSILNNSGIRITYKFRFRSNPWLWTCWRTLSPKLE